ncbi:hypothetical protein [Chamaesiphon sp.]|uniref:hypothetical protein n=1 Tax=Chamaesiphon sp. TaxID=2814140 RepID=UPI003593FF9E
MEITDDIERQLFSQLSELRDFSTESSLYQILVYDGSHFVGGSVAFLTAKELSKIVERIEKTHSCHTQLLNFYSFNIYDLEGKQINIDPEARLMTGFEVSQLRQGIDPLNLTEGEYRYDVGKVPTFTVDRSCFRSWKTRAQTHYRFQGQRFGRWLRGLFG